MISISAPRKSCAIRHTDNDFILLATLQLLFLSFFITIHILLVFITEHWILEATICTCDNAFFFQFRYGNIINEDINNSFTGIK